MKLVILNSVINFFGINVLIMGLGLWAFDWGGISLVYGFSYGVFASWVVYAIAWCVFTDWSSVKFDDDVPQLEKEIGDLSIGENRDLQDADVAKPVVDDRYRELERKLID